MFSNWSELAAAAAAQPSQAAWPELAEKPRIEFNTATATAADSWGQQAWSAQKLHISLPPAGLQAGSAQRPHINLSPGTQWSSTTTTTTSWGHQLVPAQKPAVALTLSNSGQQAAAQWQVANQWQASPVAETQLAIPAIDPFSKAAMEMDPFATDGECTGTVATVNEKFGFISQESGGDDIFVMPMACRAFGNTIPPPGTRVMYDVTTNEKTGKPRAENVQLPPPTGYLISNNGKFGFIRPDTGEDDMFVMPGACQLWYGGEMPPIGTRVKYGVVLNEKTGKPRAENVRPEATSAASSTVSTGMLQDGAPGASMGAGLQFGGLRAALPGASAAPQLPVQLNPWGMSQQWGDGAGTGMAPVANWGINKIANLSAPY